MKTLLRILLVMMFIFISARAQADMSKDACSGYFAIMGYNNVGVFQREHGLPLTEELDRATCAKVKELSTEEVDYIYQNYETYQEIIVKVWKFDNISSFQMKTGLWTSGVIDLRTYEMVQCLLYATLYKDYPDVIKALLSHFPKSENPSAKPTESSSGVKTERINSSSVSKESMIAFVKKNLNLNGNIDFVYIILGVIVVFVVVILLILLFIKSKKQNRNLRPKRVYQDSQPDHPVPDDAVVGEVKIVKNGFKKEVEIEVSKDIKRIFKIYLSGQSDERIYCPTRKFDRKNNVATLGDVIEWLKKDFNVFCFGNVLNDPWYEEETTDKFLKNTTTKKNGAWVREEILEGLKNGTFKEVTSTLSGVKDSVDPIPDKFDYQHYVVVETNNGEKRKFKCFYQYQEAGNLFINPLDPKEKYDNVSQIIILLKTALTLYFDIKRAGELSSDLTGRINYLLYNRLIIEEGKE